MYQKILANLSINFIVCLISFRRYSIPCDKSLKCRCGTPPRICESPADRGDSLATRERPQEAEMDLTLKAHHPASVKHSLFHHLSTNQQQDIVQTMDEPLDVTLNSSKNN
ncbi:hypothetical protein ALC57_09879 [Trachymyrmex cornetzi]|uniref:Uncharacterized protein n=1 Tax=Trachymyrmex cornetzi TaxID=471704 RepID=A0A151J593_9HYME|nr:hypothetical protein ALC57_09879 [Trachymyrmex cornetzi]